MNGGLDGITFLWRGWLMALGVSINELDVTPGLDRMSCSIILDFFFWDSDVLWIYLFKIVWLCGKGVTLYRKFR